MKIRRKESRAMKIWEKIKNNYFFKNIALLSTGSVFAQLIAVVCSPILTRLYSADEIGVYSYLIAIVGTFTAVLNARFDMAIVTEEEEKNLFPTVKLSMILGILISFGISIGYGVFFYFFKTEYAHYRYSIIFFFLLLIANSLINVFNSYNNRKKEYKLLTSVYVIRTGFQNIGGVAFGFFKTGVFGLMLPYTIGQFLGMRRQSKTLIPYLKKVWKSTGEDMKRVAKKHKRLPLFSVPAMLANSFSYSSVTIFIESLFNMSLVGYYSLSTRILGLPLSLVSGNVSKVFFQEASAEYTKRGKFSASYKKTFLLLLAMAVPMGVVIYIAAPWACKTFFGESWVVAGNFIRILVPYYMLRFIGTALSPGMLVCEKQQQELLIQILLVITSVVSYIITISTTKSIETFLWSICITKSVVYILLIALVWGNSAAKI